MKITQITAVHSGEPGGYTVFGLGDDNQVYSWQQGRWSPFSG